MAEPSIHCAINKGEPVHKCLLGCDEEACCINSEKGTKAYLCLIQALKRIDGSDPEPGNKCGECGVAW